MKAWIAATLLVASCLASEARSQPQMYMKTSALQLPFQMGDETRKNSVEAQLYVKNGAADWSKHESVVVGNADFGCFQYTAARDGEYSFAVVMVDRQGRAVPALSDLQPSLCVVIDTKPPTIDAEVVIVDGAATLWVKVEDQNLDPDSLRVVAELDSGAEPLLRQSGRLEYRLAPHHLRAAIRITVADLSGNVATKTIAPYGPR